MDALRSWVITLITVIILCTLIEKLAPDGGLNRYVKLICGLVITLVIIMPVIRMADGTVKLEALVWKDYVKLSDGEMKQRISRLQAQESAQMLEIYRQSLIKDIMTRYEGETDFSIREVEVVLNEDSKSDAYGSLRAIYIRLRPVGDEQLPNDDTKGKIVAELSAVLGMDKEKIMIETSGFPND